jgi:hypothetical protein
MESPTSSQAGAMKIFFTTPGGVEDGTRFCWLSTLLQYSSYAGTVKGLYTYLFRITVEAAESR